MTDPEAEDVLIREAVAHLMYQKLYSQADAVVSIWRQARVQASPLGEQLCETCGSPAQPHNFRHPFVPSNGIPR